MISVSLASVLLILFIFSQTRSPVSSSHMMMPLPLQVEQQNSASRTKGAKTSERETYTELAQTPLPPSKAFLETLTKIKRKHPLYPPKSAIKIKSCESSLDFQARPFVAGKPVLYIITPTYSRREQYVEMLRLSHTLLHVDNVIWVIAEDSENCSNLLKNMLERFGIPFAHLASPMPTMYAKEKYKPRGVASRRAAYEWVMQNHRNIFPDRQSEAVIFFADDDNTYDLEIFEEMRTTKKVAKHDIDIV